MKTKLFLSFLLLASACFAQNAGAFRILLWDNGGNAEFRNISGPTASNYLPYHPAGDDGTNGSLNRALLLASTFTVVADGANRTLDLANTGTPGNYSGITVNHKGQVTGGTNRTFSSPNRSTNVVFQISSQRDAHVSYSVDIACTLTDQGGETGTVFLEYADDNGFTTNIVEVGRFVNGNSGTLTSGLAITQNATGTVSGIIPYGKYVRLRVQNTTGTPEFNFRSGQEVLL